jgi:radical SAM protein with 4Fe4S-binding SPASM domain
VNEPSANPKSCLLQEMVTKCSHLNIPAQAVLELTYRCNLHCVHCYVDVDEHDELTLEEWKGVIDQLKAAGTIYLLFTGGEIMVRDDFLEIATYARRSGFFVGMLTNCSLITADIAQDIAELKPFSITTSLYGASAATHELVTRVIGSFERTLEGIKSLANRGMAPLVQTLVMKSNLTELAQIEKLVKSLGAEVSIDIGIAPSKTGATFPFQCEPSDEELLRCGWRPAIPSEVQDNGQGLCKAGKAMCSVSPNGNVFPCPMFPMKLGNLKQSSFDMIWRLEPCAELRYLRSMRRTDLYACSQCHLTEYCQRCTGIAYVESGRPDGLSSSACRQAETRRRLSQAAEVIPCLKNPILNLK